MRYSLLALLLISCSSTNYAPSNNAKENSPSNSTSSDAGQNNSVVDGGTSNNYVYQDYDINMVMITGQSNSTANDGTPVLTSKQSYNNISFNTGVMSMDTCDDNGCKTFQTPSSFIPLVEGDHYFDYAVETSGSSLANQISNLAEHKYSHQHNILPSIHGRSGNTYWCIRKGGCSYQSGYLVAFDQGMKEVWSAKTIAANNNKSISVRALFAIHGESDHAAYTKGTQEFPLLGTDGVSVVQDYTDALFEMQRDYQNGINQISGRNDTIPLFISQLSGWNDIEYSRLAQMQLDAHIKSNGKIVLVAPGYPFDLNQTDCLHYTSTDEQRLGEYLAKAYSQVIFEGKNWEPVRPKSIIRNGNTLTVSFYVPTPPLVFDTTRVASIANYGFGVKNSLGVVVPITSVSLVDGETLSISLASDPGMNGHLLYAQNQIPGNCVGKNNGARGNLRDSDNTISQNGYEIFNWAVNSDTVIQ